MDRYERLRTIGRGAFGIVYLVRRKGDERLVVIKQIPVDDLGKEERFSALNEVKVLAMLKHPNIIAYYDNFVEEKSLMIVMEYAPGETLHKFIEERNSQLLDEDHILLFFVQLLVAIEHVHKLNILHRDLKTQNVMFNKRRNILKIGDFGISKVLSSKITSAQTVVGTPCYISPEICEGKMYATKSDIWALGCILYELTTLQKAFQGPNLPALVMKIMQASQALPPIEPIFSTALKNLIHSLLQRIPDRRPSLNVVLATPIIVNAHLNLSTDVGRLPCFKLDPATDAPVACTRMNSNGQTLLRPYLVEEYMPPGGGCLNDKSPKPVVYLWGGGVTTPMALELPAVLVDSKVENVVCGRTQRSGVTDDGKLIFWEVTAGSLVTTRLTTTFKNGGHGRKRESLRLEPVLVSSLKTVKKVACGDMFTACLTDRGILMTFGNGANGALGHKNYKDMKLPEMVQSMLEFETIEVACGAYHVVAITSEGSIYAWGQGDRGQLGLGRETEKCHTPQLVRLPSSATVPVMACCGSDCSMVVTDSGQLFATGVNKHNKLMLDSEDTGNTNKTSQTSSSTTLSDSPCSLSTGQTGFNAVSKSGSGGLSILDLIKRPPDQSFIEMTTSGMRGMTEGIAGIPFGGEPGSGLGEGADGGLKLLSSPSVVSGPLPFLQPASHVTKPKWRVNIVSKFTQAGLEFIRGKNIKLASVGINHSAILTAMGEVLTCGDNSAGQLGYHKTTQHTGHMTASDRAPQPVSALQDLEVTKVACGDFYCTACCKDGSVYSWGRGRGGRLGKNTDANVSEPERIPFEVVSHQVLDVSCSHGVTMLLTVPQV